MIKKAAEKGFPSPLRAAEKPQAGWIAAKAGHKRKHPACQLPAGKSTANGFAEETDKGSVFFTLN
jgi:hypothetical protein